MSAETADLAVTVLFWYSVLYGFFQVALFVPAAVMAFRARRRRLLGTLDRLYANPFLPPVSVVVPAHNEESGVVTSVHALLALRYPYVEVVVVDDGSTDETFARLAAEFRLVEVPWVPRTDIPLRGRILSVHAPAGDDALVVVRKESVGVKADALNAGINVATAPLVCCVDGDSVLDTDALLSVVRPFVEDPVRTVASGGAIRTANGCQVERGRITRVGLPRRLIARIQGIEYARAFSVARIGMAEMDSLILLSGAFSLLRRDAVAAAGGMRVDTLAEDAEIVLRLHRLCRRAEVPSRVAMSGEAICWTEVPETVKILRRQRMRWAQGLAELLWASLGMLFRPRFGRIGILALPYYWAYELLSPFVVTFGLASLGYGWWIGLVGWEFVLVFLTLLVSANWLISMFALLVEEISWTPYITQGQLARQVFAGLLQGFGYVQVMAWWRVRGLLRALLGRRSWGEMTRAGFETADAADASGDEKGSSG